MSKPLNTAAVLIVQDDENSLLVTRRLLQLAGVTRIAEFCSVAEALAHLQGRVDVMLLDLQLRHEDGYSLVRELRQDPRLFSAVIVALTANVLSQDAQQAREAGFDGLIGKPLNFERFAAQVQRLLDGQPVWQMR